MKKKLIIISLLGAAALGSANAQSYEVGEGSLNPLYTAIPSLSIAPDARAGGMGDIGAATTPDVFSQHWNPSKYAFMESKVGFAFSYTPWLRTLVEDINLGYVCGYWKLGDLQAFSASFRYFSMGNVTLRENDSDPGTIANPNEFAFDLAYSRLLGEHFSMAVAFRYIRGDLNVPATSYTTYPIIGRSECQWSLGFNISNIGTKVSYDEGITNNYLPTNLKLGGSFDIPFDDYNRLSVNADINKMLVITKKGRFEEEYNDMSPITGIFKSFADSPFKEEMKEINWSVGLEYSYNQQFFVRAGYYNESYEKGGRKYFTAGAGFKLNVFQLDAGYVIATSPANPLNNTLRLSLSFDLFGLKALAD